VAVINGSNRAGLSTTVATRDRIAQSREIRMPIGDEAVLMWRARVKRVARAICVADGNDPEQLQESIRRAYEREAQKFVAAFDALENDR
jgi:hypothetical protein